MDLKRSLGFAESREGEEAGGAPEGSGGRNWASQEREAAARADGGRSAFVLIDGSRTMKAAAWLVGKLPSGFPPLPYLDGALPLDERLSHGEHDDLDKTEEGKSTGRKVTRNP